MTRPLNVYKAVAADHICKVIDSVNLNRYLSSLGTMTSKDNDSMVGNWIFKIGSAFGSCFFWVLSPLLSFSLLADCDEYLHNCDLTLSEGR